MYVAPWISWWITVCSPATTRVPRRCTQSRRISTSSAAYYRNTVIHYFVNGAIAELALLRAAEEGVTDRAAEFWEEALRLRDLLKFEFFFAEKESFLAEIRHELSIHDSQMGGDDSRVVRTRSPACFRESGPTARIASYGPSWRPTGWWAMPWRDETPPSPSTRPAFLNDCLALGKQYSLQRHIKSAESVSKVLFATARQAGEATARLTDPDGEDLAIRSAAPFAEELREAIRRVDAVEALVRRPRLSGLID